MSGCLRSNTVAADAEVAVRISSGDPSTVTSIKVSLVVDKTSTSSSTTSTSHDFFCLATSNSFHLLRFCCVASMLCSDKFTLGFTR